MNTLKVTILIYFVFNIFLVFPQGGNNIVEYEVKPVNLKDASKSQNKKLDAFFSEPAFFILKFNNTESVYHLKEEKMKSDSKQGKKLNFLEIAGGSKGIYYTNKKSKEIIQKKQTYGEEFLINYNQPVWQIVNETKKIGNYKCQKAIFNNNKEKSTVWFTTEIPYSYGPKVYCGLPGLILEVQFGKLKIVASKIILNSNQKIDIRKPSKGIKITEKEYYKKIRKIGKDLGF